MDVCGIVTASVCYNADWLIGCMQMESKQSQEMSEFEQKQNRDYDTLRLNLAREVKQLQEKQAKETERRVCTDTPYNTVCVYIILFSIIQVNAGNSFT